MKKQYKYVQDLESFFNSEFTSEQLIQAIEDMNVFAGKDTGKPNATKAEPKKVALGVLASYKIRELYDSSHFHSDSNSDNYYTQENMRNLAYQVGMEIVAGKYDSLAHAFSAYEKNL